VLSAGLTLGAGAGAGVARVGRLRRIVVMPLVSPAAGVEPYATTSIAPGRYQSRPTVVKHRTAGTANKTWFRRPSVSARRACRGSRRRVRAARQGAGRCSGWRCSGGWCSGGWSSCHLGEGATGTSTGDSSRETDPERGQWLPSWPLQQPFQSWSERRGGPGGAFDGSGLSEPELVASCS